MKSAKWGTGVLAGAIVVLAWGGVAQGYTETINGVTWTYSPAPDGTATVERCSKTSGKVVIPSKLGGDTVARLGNQLFFGCELTGVAIPKSVTEIGSYAFADCQQLKTVTIPNRVESIGNAAFCNCQNLNTITIPNSVTSIGDYAFQNCWKLETAKLGNSVTNIGDEAFRGCTSLKTITIPESVRDIGQDAFYECFRLTSVTIEDGVSEGLAGATIECGPVQSWGAQVQESPDVVFGKKDAPVVKPSTPVPTEAQAYQAMIAMKEQYPEGMPWSNNNCYDSEAFWATGCGCAGFAYILSDAAFGDLPGYTVNVNMAAFNLPAHTITDSFDVRVGDVLRLYGNTHSVIVLEVHDSYYTVAEGNYNSRAVFENMWPQGWEVRHSCRAPTDWRG